MSYEWARIVYDKLTEEKEEERKRREEEQRKQEEEYNRQKQAMDYQQSQIYNGGNYNFPTTFN